MRFISRSGYRKIIFIVSFTIFGLALGFISLWFHRQYDQWFPMNIPGDILFMFLGSHILASVLVWAILGTLLTLVFKPKIIAWIMGAYFVLFGGLWLWWESLHW